MYRYELTGELAQFYSGRFSSIPPLIHDRGSWRSFLWKWTQGPSIFWIFPLIRSGNFREVGQKVFQNEHFYTYLQFLSVQPLNKIFVAKHYNCPGSSAACRYFIRHVVAEQAELRYAGVGTLRIDHLNIDSPPFLLKCVKVVHTNDWIAAILSLADWHELLAAEPLATARSNT